MSLDELAQLKCYGSILDGRSGTFLVPMMGLVDNSL